MSSELIFAIIAVTAIVVIVPLLFHLTRHLGPSVRNETKDHFYESGISAPIGESGSRFGVKFYLVAIMFVVFDVEIIFIFSWAVNVRELGLFGIVEMFTFMLLLLAGLLYIYNKGALKWD